MKLSAWIISLALIPILLLISGLESKRTKGRKGKNERSSSEGLSEVRYNSDDFTEAVGSSDYSIPRNCSKEELENTIKRCITIWKHYCNCEHCSSTCSEDDWPPIETETWKYQRENVGWRHLEFAWQWAGKCAYNATTYWRIWCRGADFNNPATGAKERYKYWFLLSLDKTQDSERIKELCQKHECPNKQSISPQSTEMTTATQHPRPTTPPKPAEGNSDEVWRDEWQDTMDDIPACTNEVLTRILQRCILIWQDYCKCTQCQMNCENGWPPSETAEWEARGRKAGWEELEDAWKWAVNCAYNATNIWRYFCYHRFPDTKSDSIFDMPEHEYWYLTEMRSDWHPKVIESVCIANECSKFKNYEKSAQETTLETTPVSAVGRNTTAAITLAEASTVEATSRTGQPNSIPEWTNIIIAIFGAIVILICVSVVMWIYYRKQWKRARQRRKQSHGVTSSTSADENQSKSPTSLTFFGERSLPWVGESIYHTITDDPPPVDPASPTLSMATFMPACPSPTPKEDPNSKSVANVLYHVTTPRFTDKNTTRFSAFTQDSDPNVQQHTYEDTGPGWLGPTPTAPPYPQPYFVPTGEYDTIKCVGPTTQYDKEESEIERNYDHIQLTNREV